MGLYDSCFEVVSSTFSEALTRSRGDDDLTVGADGDTKLTRTMKESVSLCRLSHSDQHANSGYVAGIMFSKPKKHPTSLRGSSLAKNYQLVKPTLNHPDPLATRLLERTATSLPPIVPLVVNNHLP